MGIAGLYIHLKHRRAREKLWLTSHPGSIASIVALTARSGFGELLLPYDDKDAMQQKLSGLRFYLDHRTGAILADDDMGEHYAYLPTGRDDAMMSLLGRKQQGNPPGHWEQFGTQYDG